MLRICLRYASRLPRAWRHVKYFFEGMRSRPADGETTHGEASNSARSGDPSRRRLRLASVRLRRNRGRVRGQIRRRRRRLGDQSRRRGEGRELRLQARPGRHAIRPQRDLHRQGCRYLLGDGVAGGRSDDPRRRAAVLGRGQQELPAVRHSQQRQVLDRAAAGRQMAHHRRERRVERHQDRGRRFEQAARQDERQHRDVLCQRYEAARSARSAAEAMAGASACAATISTSRRTPAWCSRA